MAGRTRNRTTGGPVTGTRADGTTWTSWGPATGSGSTAPAAEPIRPGERLALKHGAGSAAVVAPVADLLADDLLQRRPDLAAHREAVAAWAEAEAQCLLLRAHADRAGLLDDDGVPLPYTALADRLENRAAAHRARLGLDPTSEANLARSRATAALCSVDLSAVMAAGRAALDGHTLAELPGLGSAPGDGRALAADALAMVRAASDPGRHPYDVDSHDDHMHDEPEER